MYICHKLGIYKWDIEASALVRISDRRRFCYHQRRFNASKHSNILKMGDATTGEIPYQIGRNWHSKRNRLRIISIGAGATGLLVAYKAKKLLQDYELAIYDKSA